VVQPELTSLADGKMTDESPRPYTTQKAPPDFLDGSMTRSELVTALEEIRFPQRGGTRSVELDAEVRNYLLNLLRRS
jgi:hypothetical protein